MAVARTGALEPTVGPALLAVAIALPTSLAVGAGRRLDQPARSRPDVFRDRLPDCAVRWADDVAGDRRLDQRRNSERRQRRTGGAVRHGPPGQGHRGDRVHHRAARLTVVPGGHRPVVDGVLTCHRLGRCSPRPTFPVMVIVAKIGMVTTKTSVDVVLATTRPRRVLLGTPQAGATARAGPGKVDRDADVAVVRLRHAVRTKPADAVTVPGAHFAVNTPADTAGLLRMIGAVQPTAPAAAALRSRARRSILTPFGSDSTARMRTSGDSELRGCDTGPMRGDRVTRGPALWRVAPGYLTVASRDGCQRRDGRIGSHDLADAPGRRRGTGRTRRTRRRSWRPSIR